MVCGKWKKKKAEVLIILEDELQKTFVPSYWFTDLIKAA